MTNNSFGEPLEELPPVGRSSRASKASKFWQDVADYVAKHEGKWVLVKHHLKMDPNGIAGNINRGKVAPLRGYQAAIRDGELYVSLNPTVG